MRCTYHYLSSSNAVLVLKCYFLWSADKKPVRVRNDAITKHTTNLTAHNSFTGKKTTHINAMV